MKRLLIALPPLTILILISCQKEVEDTIGNSNGGSTSGAKLIKTVSKSGSDSTIVNYTYNSSGKIANYAVSGSNSGQAVDLRVRFVRNGSGTIQKRIIKSDDLIGIGIDSIVTNVNYDAVNNRYKNAVTSTSFFGFTFKDSVVFNFDGTGKVASQIDYSNDGSGGPYEITSKIDYTYLGNNILTQKYYSYDVVTSNYTLDETDTYEYDNKTNPLQFANEAFILDVVGEDFYSANNYTKVTSVPTGNNSTIATISYTYNSTGRPLTAIVVSGSTTTTNAYTYQ
jgi:hypothetical protein